MVTARTETRSTEFKHAFADTAPLVREEWPAIDAEALAATEGDFDAVTVLVAAHADRTRVAIRRQLLELLDVALAARKPAASAHGSSNGTANGTTKKPSPDESAAKPEALRVDEMIAAIRRLESFAADEAKRVSGKVLPMAETKVRQNLWVSLLMALGLGMIVGLWLNGGRKQR